MHLDHAAHLLTAMPTAKAELTVTATASAATDTEYGRVIPVSVTIAEADGTVLATLEERFAIRGRPVRPSSPIRACRGSDDRQRDRHAASSPP